jgi:hypothetical protein
VRAGAKCRIACAVRARHAQVSTTLVRSSPTLFELPSLQSRNSRQETQSPWLFIFKFLVLGLGPMGGTSTRCWGIRGHNAAAEKPTHADSGPCDKDVRGSCLCGCEKKPPVESGVGGGLRRPVGRGRAQLCTMPPKKKSSKKKGAKKGKKKAGGKASATGACASHTK